MCAVKKAVRAALNCATLIAFAVPLTANAAAPARPIGPAPGFNPYQPVVQNDVTGAYQFRTRILVSPPSCQDFAAQADRVFYSSTLDDKTKAEQLTAVGNAAAAAACLGPK